MNLTTFNIPEFESRQLDLASPAFLDYKPNFVELKNLWKEFGHFKNILVIGHGGSVTAFMGLYKVLPVHKEIEILSTVDPDYISVIKKKFHLADTLVIGISKSGETVTQIEELMQFIDYPLLFVTDKGSVLEEIGKKVKAKIVYHPLIGGRFTAFTEVCLVPAAIAGMDIESFCEGGKQIFAQYKKNNLALQLAEIMFELEKRDIVDVFLPFYSHELFAFQNLIVQLCHESFGKNGKGQTYFAHEAPESQHHTNQRFFGGRKNIAGLFVSVDNFKNDLLTSIPTSLHSIALKGGHLAELNKMPLSFAMHAELRGTLEDAKIHDIPIVSLSLSSLAPQEIGQFVGFWLLFAVYSALLRNVDPFDQPQVENSKKISWTKRKDFNR
ncbi:MAG: glucose-6-phosphate isomerase [Candidatus Doudnabacteria bacterium]